MDIMSDTKKPRPRNRAAELFRENLLQIMERKLHWSDPAFAGLVPKDRMVFHFQNEYAVFVQPFPDYMENVAKHCPVQEVRDDLVSNMEEERIGIHYAGRPHPELFLEIPKAFGFDLSEFESVQLGPAGRTYKAYLGYATLFYPWEVGAAITTLFLEGNKYERSVFDPNAPKRPEPPLEEHPLVAHYGIPVEALKLVRIHRELDSADGEHRLATWRMLLDHVPEEQYDAVLEGMEKALLLWRRWREEVAAMCGVVKGDDGQPRLADI